MTTDWKKVTRHIIDEVGRPVDIMVSLLRYLKPSSELQGAAWNLVFHVGDNFVIAQWIIAVKAQLHAGKT